MRSSQTFDRRDGDGLHGLKGPFGVNGRRLIRPIGGTWPRDQKGRKYGEYSNSQHRPHPGERIGVIINCNNNPVKSGVKRNPC
jgi:hypothetical protein